MKRLFSLILTLCMLCASLVAFADVEVKPEPKPEDIVLDNQNLLKTPVAGLYAADIELEDGTTRTIHQYFPEDLGYRQPLVTVAMPSGEVATSFIETSGWKAIADSYGITLVLMGADTYADDEQMYMNAVFNYMDGRKYYVCQDSAFYLVGYGDAAQIIMKEATLHADLYAGAAAFGVDDMDVAYLAELSKTESAQPGLMQSEIALPIWIGANEKTESVSALIDYWKSANECSETPSANTFADEIYAFPAYLNVTNEITVAHVSKVMVSLGDRDYTDAAFLDYLYGEFLRHVRRQDAAQINALRYFATYEELGMDKINIDVDGITREFYVYQPSSVKAGEKQDVPMVISMHGGGGSGEEFYARSGWIQVAEERDFIAVFPTGSRVSVDIYAGIAPRSGWTVADVPFIKDMRSYMIEHYSVDATRIYINGQSQGSGMTQNLIANCPELFAAAGPCSLISNIGEIEGLTNEDVLIPVMYSMGKLDKYSKYGSERAQAIPGHLQYLLDRYKLDAEASHTAYQNGDMNVELYSTKAGVPLVRFQWVDEKVHAIIPDEAYAYYDYFSQWSRLEDGTLCYQGRPVELDP